jgi:hypothetical protein
MKPFLLRPSTLVAVALVIGACSSDSVDLPQGWENARPARNLVQEECSSSLDSFSDEGAVLTGGTGSIGVDYRQAHFRCDQDVEGFFKTADGSVDILVQPIHMHPSAVAACDCGYTITFVVDPVPAGTMLTTLYRRWDAINTPNDPVRIASAEVVVSGVMQ